MADEKISSNKLFEETLDELESGMNDWIKKGNPIGHLFPVPVKNDNGGWGTGKSFGDSQDNSILLPFLLHKALT
jgi:hypothetical protein